MGRSRTDIPFSHYWLGKSIHKGPFRGTFIGPIHIISGDGELGVTRRFSRARSPTEKPSRPRCEVHEQIRPSTPSGSDSSDSNAARKSGGRCCSGGRDSEPQQQVKKCPCSPSPKAAGPTGLLHPGCLASTSTLPALGHCHIDGWTPGLQSPGPFCRDSSHDYHRQAPAHAVCAIHQPVETPRNSIPSAKGVCKPMMPSPESGARHHCCYCSDDYPSEPSSYATVSIPDDGASESSVDVSPGSDKGADDCRCSHFVFAIPCGVFEVGYVAE